MERWNATWKSGSCQTDQKSVVTLRLKKRVLYFLILSTLSSHDKILALPKSYSGGGIQMVWFTHEQRSLYWSSFLTIHPFSFITGRLAPSTTPVETKCFMVSSCFISSHSSFVGTLWRESALWLGRDTSKSFGYSTGFEVDRGSVPLASVQFTRDQCSMLYSIGMGSRLNAIRDHREWDRSKLRYGLHALPYSVQGDQAKLR